MTARYSRSALPTRADARTDKTGYTRADARAGRRGDTRSDTRGYTSAATSAYTSPSAAADPTRLRLRPHGRAGLALRSIVAATSAVVCVLLLTGQVTAKIIRVPGEYPTIQQGLDAAQPKDTVLVAAGTYYENIAWPGTSDIRLHAEEPPPPDSTAISGTIAESPVIEISGPVGTATAIVGFIIENGSGESGGGIRCSGGASPIITLNHFRNNKVSSHGGAIYCGSGSPQILFNTFAGDSAHYGGAIAAVGRSAPAIENNIIEHCAGVDGGGIYVEDGASIVGNTILECSGTYSAMYLSGDVIAERNYIYVNYGRPVYCDGSATVRRCEIVGNVGGGIYVGEGSTAIIEYNLMEGNTGASGGGVYSWYAYPTIRYNTMRNNDVGMRLGGGIFIEYGAPVVERNTIVSNKTSYEAAGIYACGDTSQIRYNNISYNTCATHNPGGGIFT